MVSSKKSNKTKVESIDWREGHVKPPDTKTVIAKDNSKYDENKFLLCQKYFWNMATIYMQLFFFLRPK